jgi:Tfp pilus assembly protein PilF
MVDRQLGLLQQKFAENGHVESAAELLAFATGWGRADHPSVRRAAEVVESEAHEKTAIYVLAAELIGKAGSERHSLMLKAASARERIAGLKLRVRSNARDALSWVELARWHSVVGQSEKAKVAIRTATAIVDSDRYVVRSAARFWCHVREFGLALATLRKASESRSDPWLMASLVAVGHRCGEGDAFRRLARSMVKRGGARGLDESELAAALGSLEWERGSERIARKLLRSSLVVPAENTVAHVSWINRRQMLVEIPEGAASAAVSHEALAWQFAERGQVAKAVGSCRDWLHDEAFSAKPAIVGSYLGVMSGMAVEEACVIAREGLCANGNEPMLINNYAAALASQGQLAEASEALGRLRRLVLPAFVAATATATEGLIAFRSGRVAEGEALYRRAMERAPGDAIIAVLAELHMEMERTRAGLGRQRLQELVAAHARSSDLGVRLAVGRALAVIAEAGEGVR